MSVSVEPTQSSSGWRTIVIGLVAVLAVAIGATAGAVLLNARGAAGAGPGAAYVPADAVFYVELRVEPSAAQDEALRELLGRFPEIDGVDLGRPLHDQWVEALDEMLAEEASVDLRWATDVAPWFDGTVAFAVTHIDAEALASEVMDPSQVGFLMTAGVTDAAAARSSIDRLLDAARDDGTDVVESDHRGVTIFTVDAEEGAVAVTDDAVLVAAHADSIRDAIDLDADGGATLAGTEATADLVAQLPSDWLAFGIYDLDELMAASFAASAEMSGMPSDAFAALLEHQSLRGAFAVAASGDRISFDMVTGAPTGPLAMENTDRGLAARVPADAIYFADGGNVGTALAAAIEAMKEAMAAEPTAAEELATMEAALGADLEELVSWIGDAAMVGGWDGAEPYLGMVIVPSDFDAAERRLDQLVGFARLAALDPSMGLSVDERDVAGTTVTTVAWDSGAEPDPFMPAPTGLVVELAITDEHAIIGLGDRFVGRVLELDPSDSLAQVERFSVAVADLGGASNAAIAWLDIDGLREALEATVLPMAEGMLGSPGSYADEVLPWLEPLDRLVSVSRLEGDLFVQRGALLLD